MTESNKNYSSNQNFVTLSMYQVKQTVTNAKNQRWKAQKKKAIYCDDQCMRFFKLKSDLAMQYNISCSMNLQNFCEQTYKIWFSIQYQNKLAWIAGTSNTDQKIYHLQLVARQSGESLQGLTSVISSCSRRSPSTNIVLKFLQEKASSQLHRSERLHPKHLIE